MKPHWPSMFSHSSKSTFVNVITDLHITKSNVQFSSFILHDPLAAQNSVGLCILFDVLSSVLLPRRYFSCLFSSYIPSPPSSVWLHNIGSTEFQTYFPFFIRGLTPSSLVIYRPVIPKYNPKPRLFTWNSDSSVQLHTKCLSLYLQRFKILHS